MEEETALTEQPTNPEAAVDEPDVAEQMPDPSPEPAVKAAPVLVLTPKPVSPPKPDPAEKAAAKQKDQPEDPQAFPFSVTVGQVYDGPMDLLLDLIRKQDIDIYDIPIAKITKQFLGYVEKLKATDVDVAGEFIYMASLLIHIKSKMLLPRSPSGPEDAVEDPRRELVERLLEHERFKNAAQMLQQKQMLEAASWTNPGMKEFKGDVETEPEIAADTGDLARIFSSILERARFAAPLIGQHPFAASAGSHVPGLVGTRPAAGHPAQSGPQLQRDLH